MTFLQTGQATTDPDFRLRVQAALFKLAQDVLNEPPATPGHPAREQLASAIIREPGVMVGRFVWLCAANSSIAATVTTTADGSVAVEAPDGDIEYVCASNWDVVSGWGGVAPASLLGVMG